MIKIEFVDMNLYEYVDMHICSGTLLQTLNFAELQNSVQKKKEKQLIPQFKKHCG